MREREREGEWLNSNSLFKKIFWFNFLTKFFTRNKYEKKAYNMDFLYKIQYIHEQKLQNMEDPYLAWKTNLQYSLSTDNRLDLIL